MSTNAFADALPAAFAPRRWRRAMLRAVAVLLALAASLGAAAADRQTEQVERQQAQPGNNAPVWRDVRSGQAFSTQVQNIEAGSLVNSGGQLWREIRNGPITFYGGIWLVAVPVVILVFYFIVGPLRTRAPPTGRLIVRFAAVERYVHWTVAIAFLVMAVTGFTILFGKYYLLLLLSYPVYSALAKIAVSLHNFTAPLFAVSLVTLVFTFASRNVPREYDWRWLRAGGGLVSKHEPPAGFFNGGEKAWFWLGVVLLGLTVIVSGLVLLFPLYNQTRNVLATADVIHLLGALLLTGFAFGHIYMGTIGMRGAYRAMRHGVVDETWAREHHELWYDDLRAGRASEPAAPVPPEGPLAPGTTPHAPR